MTRNQMLNILIRRMKVTDTASDHERAAVLDEVDRLYRVECAAKKCVKALSETEE